MSGRSCVSLLQGAFTRLTLATSAAPKQRQLQQLSTLAAAHSKQLAYTRMSMCSAQRTMTQLARPGQTHIFSRGYADGSKPPGSDADEAQKAVTATEDVEEEIVEDDDFDDDDDAKTETHASTVIKTSTKKLMLLSNFIKGMHVDEAILQMDASLKGPSEAVKKCILNAVGNAENNFGMDRERLIISEAWVSKAMAFKRVKYHARGKMGRVTKPYTRITIKVKELTEAELQNAPRKARRSAAAY
eukprot:GFYU01004880.1.p1 GENE.GFYU01004880.1~~GFYU01004880.1.p1  ORF type:complete len:244 (+),score=60.02 GFYU01004880.1:218-949(+)